MMWFLESDLIVTNDCKSMSVNKHCVSWLIIYGLSRHHLGPSRQGGQLIACLSLFRIF